MWCGAIKDGSLDAAVATAKMSVAGGSQGPPRSYTPTSRDKLPATAWDSRSARAGTKPAIKAALLAGEKIIEPIGSKVVEKIAVKLAAKLSLKLTAKGV